MIRALRRSPSIRISNASPALRKLRLDIGEGERLLDGEAIAARRREADDLAVAIDGLVAAAVVVAGIDLHIDELDARAPLLQSTGSRRGR